MIPDFSKLLQDDCDILLTRALLGKTVACFGEDGFGQFGTSTLAKHFTISRVETSIKVDQNLDIEKAEVTLSLDGYSGLHDGLLWTDQNFLISARGLLKAQCIDPKAIEWPPVTAETVIDYDDTIPTQGVDNTVTLLIDPKKIVDWL